MQQTGRFIPTITATGAVQMAIDAWMLKQHQQGQRGPILRFYRWQPVALSLGYHQKDWPPQWRSLQWQGQPIDLVRRPTGGRAVLHQGDLTYAIAMPMSGTHRSEGYRRVCDALRAAWQRFGVQLEYGTAGRGYHHQPNCFALATPADLVTAEGYKLLGSAQLRQERSLLQHGTMRLCPDPDLYAQVFGSAVDLGSRPAAIPDAPTVDWLNQLATVIVQELSKALFLEFECAPLTPEELQLCEAMAPSFIPANSSPGKVASSRVDTHPHP